MLPEEKRRWENQRDKKLLKRYLKGDTTAFDELYIIYHDVLLPGKFTNPVHRKREEDAIHYVFINLLEKLRGKKYLKIVSFRAWLTASVKNYILDETKKENHLEYKEELPDTRADETADEEWEIKKDYMKAAMRKALTKLTKEERKIIDLKFLKNLLWKEVAERMGKKEKTISRKGERLMEKLKKLIRVQHPPFELR